MNTLLDNLRFILERLDWLSFVDILLVATIFFGILLLLRDTQAITLLRGVLLLIIILAIVTSFEYLPAFSWLVQTTLPTLLLAIPVIFAPEIRRALERLGRASTIFSNSGSAVEGIQETIQTVVKAAVQLSKRRHGALIVIQRLDSLQEYMETGGPLDAQLTERLLLQIFYPNTPMHDGAVIISSNRVVAASCVMPLASGNIQIFSPERQMGLRHRAAIGISEVSDAVSVVVSEETGAISVTYNGRMIRRLDANRLENILSAFYRPLEPQKGLAGIVGNMIARLFNPREDSQK